jgi:hypothetical protein
MEKPTDQAERKSMEHDGNPLHPGTARQFAPEGSSIMATWRPGVAREVIQQRVQGEPHRSHSEISGRFRTFSSSPPALPR